MDGFLARRAKDSRFLNERRVTGPLGPGTWYLAQQQTTVSQHVFSASEYKSGDTNHKMTPHKGDEGTEKKKSKKLKRKKGSQEFTEGEKKRLRNRESSDGSDSGGCWSGYESVDGKKKGEKGSCKKK